MAEKKDSFDEIALHRRSIRRYDETVDIPPGEMIEMLEMATTAPSSSNMQPWRFVVVDRPQIKEKLLPNVQFNIGPVGTAAAVIAIFGDLEGADNAEDIMRKTDELRSRTAGDKTTPPRPPIPKGKTPGEMVRGMYAAMTREQKMSIAQIDCGLVAMQLMQAARVFGYDTVPLGAYDRQAVAKELYMDEERYIPIMLLAMGKAAEGGMPPFRLPVAEVAKFI
ncbi:nitroreductase family protein [Ruminococcaceae bacterium OttesenSCG-928-I18]|nr:nitroreductase family protein [Ruminococcaceae bacterium OttesenSCG-928-I18]